MLIGRTDDPQNPRRVAASEADSPFGWIAEPIWASGMCRAKQAGHTHATKTRSELANITPCTKGAVHTHPTAGIQNDGSGQA